MNHFGNVITAMITPFHADGSVDYEAAASLATYLCEHGSDGVLVAGTTGEGATLTEQEKLTLFTTIVDALGKKATVIANVGSNNTAQTIAFAQKAAQTGVDALLVITPYYNKPNQAGCYAHFAAVAQAVSLPIILYNVPGRTGGKVEAQTVVRLARDFTNIVGIKEASGDLVAATMIARDTPDDFMLYSGEDNLTLPLLAVGGCGIISVASHLIGQALQDMIVAYKQQDVTKACRLHQQLLDVCNGVFCTVNPIPVKTCCHMLGLAEEVFRLPMVKASDAEKAFLRAMLEKAQIISPS